MASSTRPEIAPDAEELVPPLKSGDRLSRDEFERRYDAMPHLKKAELIEGIVYMPSPVRLCSHGEPHYLLITWMGIYSVNTPGVRGSDNSTVRLDLANEPQPDALLFINPTCGGQVQISQDDYIEAAPELVAEISSSSVSIDLGPKLGAYRRNGVREYLVWRVIDQQFDWFVLRNDAFEPLAADQNGVLKSQVFPGLWLDRPALLGGDMSRVIEVLRQGSADPEHARFVQQLRQRAKEA